MIVLEKKIKEIMKFQKDIKKFLEVQNKKKAYETLCIQVKEEK